MIDSAFTSEQTRLHLPELKEDNPTHISNVIFSPFAEDIRKTSWYTHCLNQIPIFTPKDWGYECIKGWKHTCSEKEHDNMYVLPKNYYEYIRDIRFRYTPNRVAIELALIEEDGNVRSIQHFSRDYLIYIDHELTWFFSNTKTMLSLKTLPDDCCLVVREVIHGNKTEVDKPVAVCIKLSNIENQHRLFNKKPPPIHVTTWVDNDELHELSGEYVIHKVIMREDKGLIPDVLNISVENVEVMNVPQWALGDSKEWSCSDEKFDAHIVGLPKSNLSVNFEGWWLVGKEFKW